MRKEEEGLLLLPALSPHRRAWAQDVAHTGCHPSRFTQTQGPQPRSLETHQQCRMRAPRRPAESEAPGMGVGRTVGVIPRALITADAGGELENKPLMTPAELDVYSVTPPGAGMEDRAWCQQPRLNPWGSLEPGDLAGTLPAGNAPAGQEAGPHLTGCGPHPAGVRQAVGAH